VDEHATPLSNLRLRTRLLLLSGIKRKMQHKYLAERQRRHSLLALHQVIVVRQVIEADGQEPFTALAPVALQLASECKPVDRHCSCTLCTLVDSTFDSNLYQDDDLYSTCHTVKIKITCFCYSFAPEEKNQTRNKV
jgi:hypothetical protein